MSYLTPKTADEISVSFNKAPSGACILCMLLCLLTLFFWSPVTYAHGPGDITLQYDSSSHLLSVTVLHPVSDPQKHYIKTITITKNKDPLETHVYKSQPESSPFTYTYNVKAEEGDIFEVKAKCNYFGSRTATLTVGK